MYVSFDRELEPLKDMEVTAQTRQPQISRSFIDRAPVAVFVADSTGRYVD